MADERPKWHPLLACEEYQPGRWVMLDQYRQPYGLIDIVRYRGDVRYRATTWAQDIPDRMMLGYLTTLREASSRVHGAYIHSLSPTAMGVPDKHLRRQRERPAAGGVQTTANTPSRTERD